MTRDELIAFEAEVAEAFNKGLISALDPGPQHLGDHTAALRLMRL